jgi:hypothetical protein
MNPEYTPQAGPVTDDGQATLAAGPPQTDVAATSAGSPPRNRRKLWIALAALIIVIVIGVALTLVLTLSDGPGRPLTIKFGLLDADSSCSGGSGGYSDIDPGMPVTVRDQDNKIIASTTLPEDGEGGFGCIWTMRVAVPDDAEQYSIEGGSRGAVTYSRQQLEEDDWTAELVLGG